MPLNLVRSYATPLPFFFNSYSSDIYTVLGLFAKSLTHLFLVLTY